MRFALRRWVARTPPAPAPAENSAPTPAAVPVNRRVFLARASAAAAGAASEIWSTVRSPNSDRRQNRWATCTPESERSSSPATTSTSWRIRSLADRAGTARGAAAAQREHCHPPGGRGVRPGRHQRRRGRVPGGPTGLRPRAHRAGRLAADGPARPPAGKGGASGGTVAWTCSCRGTPTVGSCGRSTTWCGPCSRRSPVCRR